MIWNRTPLAGGLLIVLLCSAHSADSPFISGCPIFPPDNLWNRDVSKDPIHPKSNAYIESILTGKNKNLRADFAADPQFGIPFNVVSGMQAKVPIKINEFADESDPGPYPIPHDAKIEAGDDKHLIVLDKDNCILYEMFNVKLVNGVWNCDSAAKFNLRSNALRPKGWTSADAAGLPILPGLVRYDEIATGEINHALRFTVHSTQRAFLPPATHQGMTQNPDDPPMGLRLRLKADFDISAYSGASKIILSALKKYGMFVADRGTDWYISGTSDPRFKDSDLRQLRKVPGSAFEAVTTPEAGQTAAARTKSKIPPAPIPTSVKSRTPAR